MNRFLKSSLLFSLFLMVFYPCALFLWGITNPPLQSNLNYPIGDIGHMNSRLSELKQEGELDILFLGSSHAYRGFDTRIFAQHGIDTFNLGSSSQTPIQTQILLERYLNEVKPKIIVYEVFPGIFSNDGVESSLDLLANDRIDYRAFRMAFQINDIRTYKTLIYGTLRRLFNLDAFFTEPVQRGTDRYIPGGFVEREISFFARQEYPERNWNLREKQLRAFSEVVSLIHEREIELILVYAPIPKGRYQSYHNSDYIESLMKEYSTYYNFNGKAALHDSLHFYDSQHLNQKGVQVFNDYFIRMLHENGYVESKIF